MYIATNIFIKLQEPVHDLTKEEQIDKAAKVIVIKQ